jgi:hypothetical protein
MSMPIPFDAESTADRAEFLDRYKYRLYGVIFDATVIHRHLKFKDGGEAYEQAQAKLLSDCDKWLAAIWDEVSNGKKQK